MFSGSGIYGYVILKDGVMDSEEEVISRLRNMVRTQIGGFAVPDTLLVSTFTYTCYYTSEVAFGNEIVKLTLQQ